MAQNGQSSNGSPKWHQTPPPPPPPPPLPASYRKIRRVPKLLLGEKKDRDNYIPKVVSIGPYHHGKPELQLVESFKPTALHLFFLGNKEKKEDYYYEVIRKKIIHIRNCYEQDCTKRYSDNKLVRMMLLDACFIIIYMETRCMEGFPKSDREKMIDRNFQKLGISIMSTVLRDTFLLENQIPLWIIKLLLESRYDGNELGEELLNRYMTRSLFGGFRGKSNLPRGDPYPEDLHLLEAFHSLLFYGFVRETKIMKACLSFISRKFFCCFEAKKKTSGDPHIDIESGLSPQPKSRIGSCMNYLTAGAWRKLLKNARNEGDYAKGDLLGFINFLCSVTDLKAAGVHFKPNQTLSLKDVTFESISGTLQLPFWCVSAHTKVFFMNMIAYEFIADSNPGIVAQYVNLMKLLLVRPEDVKGLREKKILCGMLGNDGEILRVYQDINTFRVDNLSIFSEEICKIQEHCNGRAKRWIAELVDTYFRSPWSFIALLATTYLLVLTTLQTIYTMKS